MPRIRRRLALRYAIPSIIVAVIFAIVWIVYVTLSMKPGPIRDVQAAQDEIIAAFAPAGLDPGDGIDLLTRIQRNAEIVSDEISSDDDLLESTLDVIKRDESGRLVLPEADMYRLRRHEELGTFQLITELAEIPSLGRPLTSKPLWNAETPPGLWSLHFITRLNRLRFRMSIEHGRDAAAIEHFDETIAAAALVTQTPISSHAMAWASVDQALSDLRHALQEHSFASTEIDRIAEIMDSRLPLPSVAMTIRWNELAWLEAIDHCHTSDGRCIPTEFRGVFFVGEGTFLDSESRWINFAHYWMMPRKAEIEALAAKFTARSIENAELDPFERGNAQQDVEEMMDEHEYAISAFHWLPDVDRLITMRDAHNTRVRGTRVMVAVEGHIAATGAPPDDLADLTPEYLDKLPIDPYSGDPFGYRRLDAPDPATGATGYLLWSVGTDGEDNGGSPVPTEWSDRLGRDVIWNRNALEKDHPGTDFIINLPRQYEE